MSRVQVFQDILIFAVVLWPLWAALLALGIGIAKALRSRLDRFTWKVSIPSRRQLQTGWREAVFHPQRPLG